MRLGIDSYSYHRLLGDVRPGEPPPAERWAHDAVVEHMRGAGAELLSLETVFLDADDEAAAGQVRAAARGRAVAVAWGHPVGLAWGEDPAALGDLLRWIRIAARGGAGIVRFVVAGPALGPPRWTPATAVRTAAAVEEAAAAARRAGVVLAVENHADLTGAEIAELCDRVQGLEVCLDTVNALRVGDDPVATARLLATRVAMVHVKDCAAPSPDAVAGPASVALGTGTVDLDGVLEAVAGARPDVAACVEVAQAPLADELTQVEAGVRWLARWRDEHHAAGAA